MTRLLAFLLLTGLAAIPSPAHSADPPPVSLVEQVKLYDQFELPCPAKDAPFCIYEWGHNNAEKETYGPAKNGRRFAFIAKPKTKLDPSTTIYIGVHQTSIPLDYRIKIVQPAPVSLGQINEFMPVYLDLAIQCQKLGYKELAADLFKQYMQNYQDKTSTKIQLEEPRAAVRIAATIYWTEQIRNPKSDWKQILKHLKTLEQMPSQRESHKIPFLIHSLESSLAPRTSKPGSLESLFDDLVDAKSISDYGIENNPAVIKLLEKGFDIIPLLIEHLSDQRLTHLSDYSIAYASHLTVSKICGALLEQLAGEPLPRTEWNEEEKKLLEKAPPELLTPSNLKELEKNGRYVSTRPKSG